MGSSTDSRRFYREFIDAPTKFLLKMRQAQRGEARKSSGSGQEICRLPRSDADIPLLPYKSPAMRSMQSRILMSSIAHCGIVHIGNMAFGDDVEQLCSRKPGLIQVALAKGP
jgi:hypothetical protein